MEDLYGFMMIDVLQMMCSLRDIPKYQRLFRIFAPHFEVFMVRSTCFQLPGGETEAPRSCWAPSRPRSGPSQSQIGDHGDMIRDPKNGYPPVSSNMAMENGPFIGDFHMITSIDRGFSIAMFDYQRVIQSAINMRSLRSLALFTKLLVAFV